MKILNVNKGDLENILELQKIAYLDEARIYNDFNIQPLTQTINEIKSEFEKQLILKVEDDDKIIGSVRGYDKNNTCHIGKLIVHPHYQNRGIGTNLMNEIEKRFSHAEKFDLFTGSKSEKNLHIYKKLGYYIYNSETISPNLEIIYLEKLNT